MDVFTIFQTVRESGGSIRTGPNGTLRLTDVPQDVKKEISANKDAILNDLWSEVRLWPDNDRAFDEKFEALRALYKNAVPFDASPFADKLDLIYQGARLLGETVGLRGMIRECFAACRESHDTGVACIRANKDKVMELVDEVATGQKVLKGQELVDVAKEIFREI